jgi:hypothetical protein
MIFDGWFTSKLQSANQIQSLLILGCSVQKFADFSSFARLSYKDIKTIQAAYHI